MAENKIFSDLDLNFIPDPMTGDLKPLLNQEALKRSLRNALQMNAFDIPFNASIKSSVKNYLFEQNNQVSRTALVSELTWLTTKIEPRIEVQSIVVDVIASGLPGFNIAVTYKIKSTNQIDSFSVVIEKVR